MSNLKLNPGVITGNALKELFAYCKEAKAALPSVNVIGSHSANAAMAAAKEAKAPIIIQLSHTGSQFYGGKTLDNSQQAASIAGSIAGALHVRTLAKVYGVPVVLHTDHCAKKILPWVDGVIAAGEEYFARNGEPLFSSHMLDLSEQPLAENIEISAKTLTRIAKMNMTLEIELGSPAAKRTASTTRASSTTSSTRARKTSSRPTTSSTRSAASPSPQRSATRTASTRRATSS